MVDGAAGSTVATVIVSDATDRPCELQGPPGAALIDTRRQILVASTAVLGGGPDFPLAAGASALILVRAANWCGDQALGAVTVGLTLPDGAQLIAEPGPGVDFRMPPCNGPGQPATLEVSKESWRVPGSS